MKNLQAIFMLVCCCLSFTLVAQSSVVGHWQAKIPAEDGTTVTFDVSIKGDGNYTVDMGGDGAIEINGKYEIKEGQMIIQDVSGSDACTSGKGVYKFEASSSSLKMTRVSDPCEGRGGPNGVMEMSRK